MVTFKKELLYEVVVEVDDLLKLHYEELTANKDRVKLDPVWDDYAALERMGRLAVYSARDGSRLVGYAAFFLNKHIHYAGWLPAINDVLFLHPDYRKGSTGIKLIRFCEQQVKKAGADEIVFHTKQNTVMLKLLDHLGYATKEVVLGKIL